MILCKTARRRSFLLAIISGFLIAFAPVLDGCARGKSESAPQSSPQMQATTASPSPIPPLSVATPSPTPVAMNPGPAPGAATAEDLQELVSPIALYPDTLVAQILAASTYPTQVVEAYRWLEQNPNLTGDALAAQVNPKPWDPSVKSLTQFPPILKAMKDSLAWTTTLGETYYNQPTDVMNAIQMLRQMAMDAGSLKDTPQQKVEVQSAPPAEGGATPSQQTIIIQPAEPNVVYVPQYNPQTVYGAPVGAAPGYTYPSESPGYSGAELLTVGLLSFGVGMLIANAINDNDNHWNTNWHGGSVTYNNNVYVSHSNTVVRPPYGGAYPRPPYSGTYPRPPHAGGYPRPGPYPGGRPPYNGTQPGEFPATLPATRPYNPAKAKEYAANNPNLTRPNFPNPNTLTNAGPSTVPNNAAERNKRNGNASDNKPAAQRAASSQSGSGKRSAAKNNAASRPAHNPAADPLRGYTKDRDSSGGRKGALGGYQPGGFAQEASSRGKGSLGGDGNRPAMGGNNGNNGGRANRGGSGRANRSGGGGRGQGGGGGGRKRD